MMADLNIVNNALASRFEALVNGGVAVLDYRIEGGTIFLLHVEVPASEQGRGIASKLSRAAFEFSQNSGLKVVPRCPFIAAYMRGHPELLQPVL
jgi:predicted GNAT family acetyltransferase